MRLIAPNGVSVSVSDEKGERLLKAGYRTEQVEAPAPPDPPKRRYRRKVSES